MQCCKEDFNHTIITDVTGNCTLASVVCNLAMRNETTIKLFSVKILKNMLVGLQDLCISFIFSSEIGTLAVVIPKIIAQELCKVAKNSSEKPRKR